MDELSLKLKNIRYSNKSLSLPLSVSAIAAHSPSEVHSGDKLQRTYTAYLSGWHLQEGELQLQKIYCLYYIHIWKIFDNFDVFKCQILPNTEYTVKE